MAFQPRLRTTIRDSLLDGLRTRFAAAGRRLLTTPRAWTYRLADALGVELEGLEAVAGDLVREVFPNTATAEGVARHGNVYGVARRPAVSTHLRVRVTGPASSTVAVPSGRVLTTSSGAVYAPFAPSVTTNGSGVGYLEIVANVAGAAGDLPPGSVLTWSAAPAGLASTATVAAAPGDTSAVLSSGEDQESIVSWAARIIARLQERPASGNRADWRDWIESVDGVGEGYVYPRTRPSPFTRDTLGCVTGVVLNPPPSAYTQSSDGGLSDGLDPNYSRVPTPTLLAHVRGYIDGTLDAHAVAVPEATQRELYPATIHPDDWGVIAPPTLTASVHVQLKVDPARFAWRFNAPVAVSTASATTLTFAPGDWVAATFVVGDSLAVPLGGSLIRGAFFLVTVTAINADTRTLTVSPSMPGTPSGGTLIYPDAGVWNAGRAAVLSMIDRLGPGLFTTGRSVRYPPESFRGPAALYVGQIYSAVMAVPGVVDAIVTIPGGPVVPSAGTIVVPGEIRFEPTP